MKRYQYHIGALLLFISFACLIYPGAVTGEAAFWGFDWDIFHPYMFSVQQRFQEGHLLLWNRQLGLGYPQFAEGQSLQLYPPLFLLLKIMPFWWACSWLMIIHLTVAAVGTYTFCLGRGLPRSSSLLAACTFAFSGFMSVRYHHPTIIAAIVWMPLLLALIDRGLAAGRIIPNFLWAGIVLALQLLTGHQQFTFYSLCLVVVYTVFRCQELTLHQTWRFALRAFLVMLFIGVGIGCLQVTATYTMLPWMFRRALPPEIFMTGFGLPPANLLLWFLPHLFGTSQNYMGQSVYWETTGYVTALPWLLGCVGFILKPRDRDLRFWAGVVIGSLLLAITDSNPLYSILPHIPIFNSFRAPARYLILAVFGLAMLMGHGHALVTQAAEPEARQRAIRGLSIVAIFIVAIVSIANFTFCGGQHVALALLQRQPLESFFHPVRTLADAIYNSLAGWDSLFLLLHIVVGSAIIIAVMRRYLSPPLAVMGLVLLLFTDLCRVAVTMAQTISPAYFAYEPPTATFLNKQDGLSRIWTGQVDLTTVTSSPHLANLDKTFVAKNFLKASVNVLATVDHADAVPGLQLLRQFNLQKALSMPPDGQFFSATDEFSKQPFIIRGVSGTARENLLSLLNVRFLITTDDVADPNWKQVYNEGVRIYENRRVLPRAFVVGGVQVQSPQMALETIASPDFEPQSQALLETEPSIPLPSKAPVGFHADATIHHYSDTEIKLETQSNNPGLLVISDAYYPDWKAWVDGVETPIMIADYALRGIALPAGKHLVECRYQPRWWWPALGINILAIIIVLPTLLISTWRFRHPRPTITHRSKAATV